jgi:hypothetical protein
MEATIDQIPHTGKVQLTIQVSADMNYSASAARRMVGRLVAEEIGYLLRSGEPTLVASERIYWRVPVILALPNVGPVGTVGTIDVDIETGQLIVTSEQIAEITQHAKDLATHHSSPGRPTP